MLKRDEPGFTDDVRHRPLTVIFLRVAESLILFHEPSSLVGSITVSPYW